MAAGVPTDARRRFEREAQVIARLRSPHTVELFDFGVADDGGVLLRDGAAGRARSGNARARSRSGARPSARSISSARYVTRSPKPKRTASSTATSSPPTFRVPLRRRCDFVKVLDFGIVEGGRGRRRRRARPHAGASVHGTPAFIAPEQALGRIAIDGRADIYATGCVATGCSRGNWCSRRRQTDGTAGAPRSHAAGARRRRGPSCRSRRRSTILCCRAWQRTGRAAADGERIVAPPGQDPGDTTVER